MIQKKEYKQAAAEIVLFDNSDVIRTSGGDIENSGGGCKNRGHSTGNGCKKTSGLGGETGSCRGSQKIK